jgi:integrase
MKPQQTSCPFQKKNSQSSTKNGKIIEVLWELKKTGRAEATIRNIGKALHALEKHCNLDNPEAVRTWIATADKSDGYKRNLCSSYDHYTRQHGLTWKKPKYRETVKMPKIPQENKIELIMANSPLKLRTAITISKDTGLRPVELMRITLRNLDLTNGAIYPETAKHGSPRVLKLKNSTINLLNKYLANRNIGLNENIFGTWNSDTYGKWFRHYRNKTAEKMQDLTLKSIRLYDLRHFFATMLYHKTKDILFVKQQMGHKKIETTLVYTQLLQFDKDDNYTCKVAQNVEQATELIENGFEYVTEMDGLKLFRKRK